jgi:hypothetical protein
MEKYILWNNYCILIMLMIPNCICFLNTGSKPMLVSNTYGIKIDLSWFNIVSSIFSIIAILFGSRWTVNSIQEETNTFVAILVFIPLFFFRMFAWMIIITLLHTFSLAVFGGFVLINILVFVFLPDPMENGQFETEPLGHSFLSIIFPVSHLPTSSFKKGNKNSSLKLQFWLVLIGNLILFGVLIILFLLYNYNIYNPWCSEISNKLLIPESLMNNIQYLLMSIFSFATVPVIVCFATKSFG